MPFCFLVRLYFHMEIPVHQEFMTINTYVPVVNWEVAQTCSWKHETIECITAWKVSVFGHSLFLLHNSPYSIWILENMDQKNSKYGRFSCSVWCCFRLVFKNQFVSMKHLWMCIPLFWTKKTYFKVFSRVLKMHRESYLMALSEIYLGFYSLTVSAKTFHQRYLKGS